MGIALDEQTEKDRSVEVDDMKFIYEPELEPYIDVLQIDYRDSWLYGKGFSLNTGISC